MKIKTISSILFFILFFSISNALDGDIYDLFLPNGMKVILMEKHSAPKVGLGIYYNVGSHDEKWGQKGINRIVRDLILAGTKKYSSDLILTKRHEFATGYGDSFDRDITYFYSELPKEELEFGLDYESDRMRNAIIQEHLDEVKIEYKIKYEEYHENGIWVSFNNSLSPLLPSDHPYKTDQFGIWEQIDTLSVETCQHFYNQYYTPNNAVLVVVGNIIPEDATKLIYKYFAAIESSDFIPSDPDFSFDKNILNEMNEYPVKNKWSSMYFSLMAVNFFMPSARSDDAILMGHFENILIIERNQRGKLNKKFTNNNRAPNQLWFDDNVALGPATFIVGGFSPLKKGNIEKFTKSVLSTFEYIGKNGVDNELIEVYKKSELLKAYKKNNDYSSIANRLGKAELISGDYNYYNRKIELLEELSNEDIKKIVNKYFHADNMYSFTIIGNPHLKKWYHGTIIFIANNFIFPFYNPFIEEF